ncbi:unnamed protein product [Cladocopium goreaui]|uniref:Sodium channel protein type 11 subunit alpha n=1 Tax=Cladocopium goreaui TaxID=2562237 RepID=A0A9P1BQF0_9DINO|nr:unnamed protein product [Cladocopium goreaui]
METRELLRGIPLEDGTLLHKIFADQPRRASDIIFPTKDASWYAWWRFFTEICRIIVGHQWFELLISLAIMVNSVMLGVESQMSLTHAREDLAWARIAELCFLAIFTVEILLRLAARGWRVIKDGWFLFDSTLVIIACIEQFVELFSNGNHSGYEQQVLVLRTTRLFRLIRTFRMIKQIRSVWRLVYGLITCGETITSTFILLFIVLYVFGVMGHELITKDGELRKDPEIDALIVNNFSSLPLAMMTLVRFVTMDSISVIYAPLIQAKALVLGLYFGLLICVVSISLMNLVTAVMVEGALEHARQEKEYLDVVNNVWSTMESFLRLRTNEEKSQIWARSPEALAKLDNTHYSSNASFTMQVLGATLGPEERALSDRERDTLLDVARRSRRIACLPVSARLKGRLAATVLGPKAVWGHVINGRCPTQKDIACFFRHYKAATSDNRFVKGRSSMDLKRAFFFGHTCDLAFYGALRTISSGFAWARHCASLGENCRWSQSTVFCLNSILQDLGWCAHSNAVGQSGDVPCIHFGAVKAEVDKCLHHIRDAWRLKKVRQWLSHRTRIDSGIGLVGAAPIKSLRISWCRWAQSGQLKLLVVWHLRVLAEAEAWLPWAAMHCVLLLAAGHGQHAVSELNFALLHTVLSHTLMSKAFAIKVSRLQTNLQELDKTVDVLRPFPTI